MNLVDTLKVNFDLMENSFIASMPATSYYSQPQGYVTGGVYLLFAEYAAGHASNLLGQKSENKYYALGQNINAHHLKSKKADGSLVIAKGTLLHKGKSTHLWDVKIVDEKDKLLSNISVQNFIIPLEKAISK